MSINFSWALAIIAARESAETLKQTIKAARIASADQELIIDVLVNGNPSLAQEIASWARSCPPDPSLRVWSISQGDKAHAWNEYVHRIWPVGRLSFFLDGYAQPRADGLSQLAENLTEVLHAFGATGVPSSGRSAPALRDQMLRIGGFHGNMHAIPAHAMEQLRAVGFRLPLGLYRTDSLIGAVLMFGLDPAANAWEPRRIVVNPKATWDVPGQADLTIKNITGQFKRRFRQAQGDLENRAVREHLAIRKLPIHLMPKTARELVLSWIEAHPDQARQLYIKNPLRLHAARQMRASQNWSGIELAPELLYGAM